MAPIQQNYFACTLGHAADRKTKTGEDSFKTILHLIDEQAERFPDLPALGFADVLSSGHELGNSSWLSFSQLRDLSRHAAHLLSPLVSPPNETSRSSTIGLLCTSSLDFAITWLGLMRLGFSVILLAPQLRSQAIEHLCTSLKAEAVLVDKRCSQIVQGIHNVTVVDIPKLNRQFQTSTTFQQVCPSPDIAFYFHTSGTSAGLPKPIPQRHEAVSSLPSFSEPDQPATFSATPLYHGGIADCLRAWTSGAMIWFFPEGVVPVTSLNLKRAINFSREKSIVPIQYFSSVPYILQMLAEDSQGLELLQSMDLVGYGGAALPPSTGDFLVKSGVNLLSRFGSAECGFLLSSHRDYATDSDWRYLRHTDETSLLSFEPREDGLSELVVKPGWPLLSKTNRDDGSFATADLFEPHSSTPNAWRYHSRADAQITLANGKKFDPAPIEAAILALTNLLQDVLVFGNGHDYPGALVFPSQRNHSQNEVLDVIWPYFEAINQDSQSHARISRAMVLVVHPSKDSNPLEKSSKGTILRRQAEERYAGAIQSAYGNRRVSNDIPRTDKELASTVKGCFGKVLRRILDPDRDLYQQGVDSLSCIQIRKMIESSCLPLRSQDLPLNILYDQGTINSLIRYLRDVNDGRTNQEDNTEALAKAMGDLTEEYSRFRDLQWSELNKQGEVVVLTGATGFLGSHILHLLRQNRHINKIICLLRAQTALKAHERVSSGLYKRGIPALEPFDRCKMRDPRVVCLTADLSSPGLGLSEDDRHWILEKATVVLHSAWTVNFTLRLQAFEDQIAGTRNLINTAAQAGARFTFVSSTAAVSSSPSITIPETVSQDPRDASPLGYSQSKWVAEQVCQAAYIHTRKDTGHLPKISITRVGQLCGNQKGAWNMTEAYPLLLSTAGITGCLPDLPGVVLDWMPVEKAAEAVIEAAFIDVFHHKEGIEPENIPVYHILNPNQSPSWRHMLQWLRKTAATGPEFEIMPAPAWLERFKAASSDKNPAQALLGLWEGMMPRKVDNAQKDSDRRPTFSITEADSALPAMREVKPLERKRLLKIWAWVYSEEAN